MGHGESWKDRLTWSLGGLLAAVLVMAVAGAVTHLVVKDPEATVTASATTTDVLTGSTTSTTSEETGKGKNKGETTTTPGETTSTTPTIPGDSTTSIPDPSEIVPPSDSGK
jgi:hypothetical protein